MQNFHMCQEKMYRNIIISGGTYRADFLFSLNILGSSDTYRLKFERQFNSFGDNTGATISPLQ